MAPDERGLAAMLASGAVVRDDRLARFVQKLGRYGA
jgi:hypothetical protein